MKEPSARKSLCGNLGIDFNRLITLEQTHSKNIVIVNEADAGKVIPAADGLITDTENLPVAVFSADCLPVFIGSRKRKLAAMVHAGWQGVAKGIIPEAVRIMKKEFKADPKELFVVVGPHIQPECFQIGDDLREVFKVPKTQTHLSLSEIALEQLAAEGVSDVSVSKACTHHEPGVLFSFRRDKSADRMMSLIKL